MDPPWNIRFYLKYNTLSNEEIFSIPIQNLLQRGYLFIWIVNQRERSIRKWIEEKLKFEIIDKITWVKVSKHHKLIKGSGVTLRHSEETCLVARKGYVKNISKLSKVNNVIVSEVRGSSVKP